MNNKLLFLIGLIFSINGINGIKMTEKEILNLNLTQYNNANVKCPEFGYDISLLNLDTSYPAPCRFTFYCIDDNNCQSDNYNSTFLEFIDNNGNIRKYMKNDENCTEDSDCLSNKCLLNTCKQGNNSMFTECSDNYIYTSDDSQQGYQKIKCGKINGSQCNGRNQVDECAGHCNNLSYCESHRKGYDYVITIETTNKTSSTTPIEKSTSTNSQPKYFVLIGYGLFASLTALPIILCCYLYYVYVWCDNYDNDYPSYHNYYNRNNNTSQNNTGYNNNNNNINNNLDEIEKDISELPEVYINICTEDEKDMLKYKYQITPEYKTIFERKVRKLRNLNDMKRTIRVTTISIARNNLLNDAFDSIMNLSIIKLKRTLRISYSGEEGTDAGGLLRDFFYQLSKEIGNPNYLLFKYHNKNSYELEINPKSDMADPQYMRYFKFVGRLMGLALINKQHFPLYLNLLYYKRLIGKEPELSDLQFIDAKLYKNLNWLKENEGIKKLNLTFSIEEDDCFGNRTVIDLKPDGANIEVTDENKNEYIDLVIKHKLNVTDDEKQFNEIKKGFYEVIPQEINTILNEFDLKFLIAGINEINVNDWKNNTVYEGYTLNDPTITYFWMFVNELSKEEKSLLLIFATGTSQIPATGFKDLQGNGEIECFKIKRVGNEKDLPVSHTCFNRIDLPPYSSYTMLKQKMMKAITEGITGFQLS